jgi:hypothetical protein
MTSGDNGSEGGGQNKTGVTRRDENQGKESNLTKLTAAPSLQLDESLLTKEGSERAIRPMRTRTRTRTRKRKRKRTSESARRSCLQ